jgi:hypothetical protein
MKKFFQVFQNLTNSKTMLLIFLLYLMIIRKIIVAFGLLIFIYSLFEVLRSFRVIQERFVSIFEGEIVSKVSLKAKEAVFKDDIAYASEVDLSFGAENIGDVKVFADKSTYNIKKE